MMPVNRVYIYDVIYEFVYVIDTSSLTIVKKTQGE